MKFSKILVAEDTDSMKKGIVASLKETYTATIEYAQHCDIALRRIENALHQVAPYELLICDLSFIPRHKNEIISDGIELIKQVKTIQPGIRTIVFSVEDKQPIIKSLFDQELIDGYVCKGLNGLSELQKAINMVGDNKQYKCPVSTEILRQTNVLQLTEYDKKILQQLAKGMKQSEISGFFKENNISPSSISAIEKRLNKLKEAFQATNPAHLVFLASSTGLI